jgi:hypothetical protein
MRICGIVLFLAAIANAQEASSGFELRTTVSESTFYSDQLTEQPRGGDPVSGGFRAMLYPTWKLSSHWAISGAVQVHSRPYFEEEYETQGYGVRADTLQANLSYSNFWEHASIVVRAGELSSAFGSFLQRYDDSVNPLIGIPSAYGYYYKPVAFGGLAGAEVDATAGKFDMRAQLVNSSPANRRSIFDHDQYGNWAGGVGYTIRQGFRIGASTYYGPYLDRQYPYFFPGEANPNQLPAYAYGLDVQWGKGPWNAWGELQHFTMEYHAIPTFTQHTGYAELRRVLNPRWYVAARLGYLRSAYAGSESYEVAAGFRPNTHQLLKFSYQIQHGLAYPGTEGNVAAIELVTFFRAFSLARN